MHTPDMDASGDLFAVDIFPVAGGQSVNRIARWDGGNWSPLEMGTNGTVEALVVDASDTLISGLTMPTAGLDTHIAIAAAL